MNETVPRPLPRRPARSTPRLIRPRFQTLDAVWMLLLTAAFLGFSTFSLGAATLRGPGTWLGAATVAVLYALGWRTAGRAAGVIAAFLLASSRFFASGIAADAATGLLALLTTGALLAFVAGSSLIALLLSAIAVWIRPDGLLLGFVLLGLSLAQRRPRAWLGALAFAAVAGGGWAALVFLVHRAPALPGFAPDWTLLRIWVGPSLVFLTWFWLPLLAELGEPTRRPRWLAPVGWTVLFFVVESLFRFAAPETVALAFFPVAFLLTAGGLSRLLPTLAGEFPALRYVIAVLAVLSLAAMRARVEWGAPAPLHLPSISAASQSSSPRR